MRSGLLWGALAALSAAASCGARSDAGPLLAREERLCVRLHEQLAAIQTARDAAAAALPLSALVAELTEVRAKLALAGAAPAASAARERAAAEFRRLQADPGLRRALGAAGDQLRRLF